MTTTRPKVLHVLGRLAAGGTERQLLGMLDAAHGHVWDPTLLVLRPEGELLPAVEAVGYPVLVGPPGHDLAPGRLRLLRESIRAADCVHTQLWGTNLLVRLVAATLPRRPAIVAAERRVETWRSARARRADRIAARWCDRWVANSDAVAAFVADAHGLTASEVTVIRNGIDSAVFHPREGHVEGRPIRIGCLGRLVEQKGIDLAIDAMRRLHGRHDIELLVVGDGPDRDKLEQLADGLPVTFLGLITEPARVADFLHSLDLFVFPSRYEGLPNAMLEARACAIPVVATAAPGVAEAADEHTVLVAPNDSQALAGAIEAWILAGHDRTPAGPARGFDQVAAEHAAVFDLAIAMRGASTPARRTAAPTG